MTERLFEVEDVEDDGPCRHRFEVIADHDRAVAFGFRSSDRRTGRPYHWRISECRGCGTWFTEGSFAPFPDHPSIGEPLR